MSLKWKPWKHKDHPNEFESDGCTWVPDLNLHEVCVGHDYRYWEGGTEKDRRYADKLFRIGIRARGRPFVAWLYWLGVRAFGWYSFNYHKAGKSSRPD